ncbi:3-hydroxy-2-methylbutyryl-CoA dehydrogenase [Actinotalea ferrariae CF5-4]|uniref:3-hydroxy-2-methylbutyryl-CoA dehydrogenase n=1 Tax=Actinotalea ferrariae CF5-4 TaxID=948458 RepID=A0A021VS14_9CELL|nr:SDR family NAD(P)-dependent oxidoreductase [Actinotalea ferrariae]EYR63946.1 3-hydroxy-2-methylbutyryl-CoA dehydrogenase [Actinotalea ferrariae CF5-4]
MRVDGVAAVVTGGASGLGAATAALLAGRGAAVHVLDLPASIERCDRVEGVTYVPADVTDPDGVRAAVGRVPDDRPLRVLVSCAGIAPGARVLGKAGPHDPALFARVVAVNLVGTFTVMTVVAERMAATEPDENGQRGVVVNTASVAAFDGQVGQAAYAASKGGVAALTLPAARDLAQHGIRVMTIAPGIVDTPMMAGVTEEFRERLLDTVPFPRRFGLPEEYAQLALAVVEHDYLNGETIRMDGALRMPPL